MFSGSLERTHHTSSLSFLLEEIAVNVQKTNVSLFSRLSTTFFCYFRDTQSSQGHMGKQLLRLMNKYEKRITLLFMEGCCYGGLYFFLLTKHNGK